MKTYTVEGPDGRRYKIEGPEGATADQLAQVIMGQSGAENAPSYNPTDGMSTLEKLLVGTGQGMTNVGRGIGQFIPVRKDGEWSKLVTRDDVAEARKLDAPLLQTGAGATGSILGNVVSALPAAFIPGANTAAGSAAIGAGYGLLQPSVSTDETLMNTGIGAAAGSAVPLLTRGAKVAKSFIDPLYQKGREKIIGRTIAAASGGQADDVLRNLQSAKDIVPGSQLTTAQAANVPSLAALERTASAVDPSVANQYAARTAAQNQARVDFLQSVTPDKAAAVADRSNVAGALYDRARAVNIEPAAITPKLQGQIDDLMGRLPDDVVGRAKELARLNGVKLDDIGSVQGLHWVKKGLDSKIETAVRAGDGEMVRAYRGLQGQFLDTLDELSPDYQQARQTFARMSPPVEQADILSEIQRKATNFRGDMTPAAFSRAASDQTAKSATGNPLASLVKNLNPKQKQVLEAIKQDLQLSDFAQNAGRGVGSDTVQKMAYSNMINQAGIPTFVQNMGPAGIIGNVAQRAGQVVYKDANERMAAELAEALLDPRRAAELLKAGIVTPQQIAISNAMNRGSAVIGASAPGLLNLGQQ